MGVTPRVRQQRLLGDAVDRVVRAAEQPPRQLRPAEEQRRVVLPGRADATVDVDHRAGGVVERVAGLGPSGARRERELLRLGVASPAGVVLQAAAVLLEAQHLGELVLDRLVGADRAPEREPLLGVRDAHLEARLHRPERLSRDQRMGEIPGVGEHVSIDRDAPAPRLGEGDVPERAGRVVAHHRLDRDALGIARDGDRHRFTGVRLADRDEQVGGRGIGDERHRPVEHDGVALDGRAGRLGPAQAAARLHGPAGLELARRPRWHVHRPKLAGRDRGQRLVTAGVQDRRRGQQAEHGDAREHAPAFLGHEQRVEAAESGAAMLLRRSADRATRPRPPSATGQGAHRPSRAPLAPPRPS